MRYSLLPILLVMLIAQQCAPVVDPGNPSSVSLNTPFAVEPGDKVELDEVSIKLYFESFTDYYTNGAVAANTLAYITLNFNDNNADFRLSHTAWCELDFVGWEDYCIRNDSYYARLDSIASLYAPEPEHSAVGMAELGSGYRIYFHSMVLEQKEGDDHWMTVSSAEFEIRSSNN